MVEERPVEAEAVVETAMVVVVVVVAAVETAADMATVEAVGTEMAVEAAREEWHARGTASRVDHQGSRWACARWYHL